MSARKVTVIFPGDINTLTGGYRYDKRIVEGLREQSTGDGAWQVSLISLDGEYPFPSNMQLQQAADQLNNITDDSLVVIDGLAYSVMPELMALHAQRLQIVALIHHPLALETGLSAEQSAQLRLQETQALQHARHVITTSELTASSLVDFEVPDTRITAVLPGTDTASLAQGSGAGSFNLLCVATITQRKGHHLLLEALSTMPELPWHLNCVGSTERDGLTYKALYEQCENLGMSDRVSFMGELQQTKLSEQYAAADLFVLASYHEGYGMVLSEAIARGLPIIGTNAGAISQTVPEGAGILVPPGESPALARALRAFMEDAHLRSGLTKAAVSAREHLRSWQLATGEFSEVLARITAKG